MKAKDEITDLFRNRLSDAKLSVRDGFWEELQSDLAAPASKRELHSPRFYRWVAAASVALVLGMASAAFWYLSPKEEIKDAFTQVSVMSPEAVLQADRVQETVTPPFCTNPSQPASARLHSASATSALPVSDAGDEEEMVSVRVSITIQQRMYGNGRADNRPVKQVSTGNLLASEDAQVEASSSSVVKAEKEKMHRWALKASLGTSLSKGDCELPLTASLTAERRLTECLSLESGLQYNRLGGETTLHTLAIPLKLHALLASGEKLDFYATAGGAVEKCIAGAPDNSFSAEPLQLSVMAGVGVRYKMTDRLALFAEPTVSHHFDTASKTNSLRTERATNLNFLCGLRVTY